MPIAGNLSSSVDQAEDIVEHEEAACTVGLQREELGIVHGLLLLIDLMVQRVLENIEENRCRRRVSRTYQESAGNQDDDAVSGGLGIESGQLVAHLLEGQALFIETRLVLNA